MANNKSALKRIKIGERNRLRNKAYKSEIKTLTKKFFNAVQDYIANPNDEGKEKIQQSMSVTYSKIDKAVKRKVLHANNGARKKARLAKAVSKATAAS